MIDQQPGAWKPYAYHKRALRWLLQHPYGLLLLDLGLGKTSIVLKAFDKLRSAKRVRKALVIAPLRPCQLVWSHEPGAGELWRWTDFHHLRVELLHGPKKDDALERDADLYVINYDGLRWLHESGGFDQLIKCGVDLLVADEVSKLKNPSTQRFKVLKRYLPRVPCRWGLTGTPETNSLLDVFGETYVADLGETFGPFVTHFRNHYFFPSGYGGYTWSPQPTAEKEIFKKLKKVSLSMRAADHLDLPALVERDIWVDLPPAAREVYESLEDDLIAQLDDGVLTASNAAVASGKCRQIAGGGVYRDAKELDSDGFPTRARSVHHLHEAKVDALADLVDELQGSPLLILFEFKHDLERIRSKLGKSVPSIDGDTSDKHATKHVNAWNEGRLQVLCGHPAAMGHGLNLQRSGHHLCWVSLTWNLELYHQANKRVHRLGQQNRVIVHRILARDTIDEVVAATLRRKHRSQERLLDELRSYADKRKTRQRG